MERTGARLCRAVGDAPLLVVFAPQGADDSRHFYAVSIMLLLVLPLEAVSIDLLGPPASEASSLTIRGGLNDVQLQPVVLHHPRSLQTREKPVSLVDQEHSTLKRLQWAQALGGGGERPRGPKYALLAAAGADEAVAR